MQTRDVAGCIERAFPPELVLIVLDHVIAARDLIACAGVCRRCRHLSTARSLDSVRAMWGLELPTPPMRGWDQVIDTAKFAAGPDGRDALLSCAEAGGLEDVSKISFLLSMGIDVDARNDGDWTALKQSSLDGRRPCVDLLLAAGADVNAFGSDGWTALMIATARGHTAVMDALVAVGAHSPAE